MEPIPVAAWVCSALFVGLRVRIPPGGWMSVSCECCVCCQVEVSATGRSLVQRSPTECVCLSVISKPQQWVGLGPLVLSSHENKNWILELSTLNYTFSSAPVSRKISPIQLRFRLQQNDRYVRFDSRWSGWSRSLLAVAAGLLLSLSAGFWTRLSWKVEEKRPWISHHHCLRAPPHSIELSLHTLSYIKQDSDIDTRNISVWLIRR